MISWTWWMKGRKLKIAQSSIHPELLFGDSSRPLPTTTSSSLLLWVWSTKNPPKNAPAGASQYTDLPRRLHFNALMYGACHRIQNHSSHQSIKLHAQSPPQTPRLKLNERKKQPGNKYMRIKETAGKCDKQHKLWSQFSGCPGLSLPRSALHHPNMSDCQQCNPTQFLKWATWP